MEDAQDQRAGGRRRAAARGRRAQHPRPAARPGGLTGMAYPTSAVFPGTYASAPAASAWPAFDVDGTLTDGRLWFDHDGSEMKAFHVQDGPGLRLLVDNGIAVALITARESASVRSRAEDLRAGARVHRRHATSWPACAHALRATRHRPCPKSPTWATTCPTCPVFPHVGLAVAPANAHAGSRDKRRTGSPASTAAKAPRAHCAT